MQSMTGFGFASANSLDFKLEISIKSVNSRFLDTKFYIPPYYICLESEFQKMILKNCKRGSFFVRIERYPHKPIPIISLKWDKKQAQKWKKLYENLSKEMKISNNLTAGELAHKEGVIRLTEQPKTLNQTEKEKIKKSFYQAFQTCLKERKREGLILKKDILSNVRSIQSFVQKVKVLNNKQKKNSFKQKTKYLKQKDKLSKDRVLEVEKFDIHEEIIRTEEHLKHFKTIANNSSALGRKMDFYIQEILREMNTMGSKSQSSNLTLKIIEGKFLLEKIKEQVQNIE